MNVERISNRIISHQLNQHGIVILYYTVKAPGKKRIRAWKIKKREYWVNYPTSVISKIDDAVLDLDWKQMKEIVVSMATYKLAKSPGKLAYERLLE